jgi:antitoxin VapB
VQTARVFKSGNSQAVRLPKEFRIEGDRVYIKRDGDAIVLLPCEKSWQGLLEAIEMFSDDFMEDRNQPEQQQRPELDELFQ